MEEKKLKLVLELIEKLAGHVRIAALKGIAPHEFSRLIAANLEVKYGQKEITHAEGEINKITADIKQHLVESAEDEEVKVLLKEIPPAIKNLYHAMFNILVFEKVQVAEMHDFVHTALNKMPAGELRTEIKKAVSEILDFMHDNLRTIHDIAQEIIKHAKGGTTVANKFIEMMHTSHAGFMRRHQEQTLVKDAHKKATEAEQDALNLVKGRFKSREEADKKVEEMIKDEKISLDWYAKAVKLEDLDMDEASDILANLQEIVKKAVGARELPKKDVPDMKKIHAAVVNHLIEPFAENLETAINQLDALRKDVVAMDDKL